MKKFLLLLVLVLSITQLKAQNFSTHVVRSGETIDGISKRYHVSPFDIYKLNPDAKNIKPDMVLIIPISKAVVPKVTKKKELLNFIEHITQRKETVYGISKHYNISEADLKRYNNKLYSKTLSKGDVLRIPRYRTTKSVENTNHTKPYIIKAKEGKWRIAYEHGITVDELEFLNPQMKGVINEGDTITVPNLKANQKKQYKKNHSYYEVLPREGFYRLKLKLGLDQSQLEALNPELKETGLKAGMILKISNKKPAGGSYDFNSSDSNTTVANLVDSISDFNTKHIAIMLPFRMDRVDFSDAEFTKNSIKKDPYLNTSLDFYSGVLMALDSLKALNVSLKVDVYDTKSNVTEVTKIINGNSFNTMDAVIGPLTSASFETVASKLQLYKTPVISPIGKGLNEHDNVFQSRPPRAVLKAKIVNFVKRDSLANILVISDSKHETIVNELKKEFSNLKVIYSRKTDKGKKDGFFVTKDDLEVALKPKKNIVFLETQNEGYAANVTSILASFIREEDKAIEQEAVEIMLVTTNINAAFQGKQVDNMNLSSLQFHYPSVSRFHSDNNNNPFIKAYKKQFNMFPNNAAVRGFDLTMDVVLRLVSSDNLYTSVPEAPLTEYVESKFAYKTKPMGGYFNTSVYLIKYDHLDIVEVE